MQAHCNPMQDNGELTPLQQFELGRRISESAEMRKRFEEQFMTERKFIADQLAEKLTEEQDHDAIDGYRERALLSHRRRLNARLSAHSPENVEHSIYARALAGVNSRLIDLYAESSTRIVEKSRQMQQELDNDAVSSVEKYVDYPDFERYLRNSLSDEDITSLRRKFHDNGRDFPSYQTSMTNFQKLIATDGRTPESGVLNEFIVPYLALRALVKDDDEVASKNYIKIFKLIKQFQDRYELRKTDRKAKFHSCIIFGKRCMIDKQGKLEVRELVSELKSQIDFFAQLQSFSNSIMDAYDIMNQYVDGKRLNEHFPEMKRIHTMNGRNISIFKKMQNFCMTFEAM